MTFKLSVNDRVLAVRSAPDTPLLWILRDEIGLAGTKFGCGMGLCGACTVHIDGVAMRSCQTPLSTVGERKVTTIEGVGSTSIGASLQRAWIDQDVVQCGYCQAGQIMSAASLLARVPQPTDEQINRAMAGNICRCGTYARIRSAIHLAAGSGAGAAEPPTPQIIDAPALSSAEGRQGL